MGWVAGGSVRWIASAVSACGQYLSHVCATVCTGPGGGGKAVYILMQMMCSVSICGAMHVSCKHWCFVPVPSWYPDMIHWYSSVVCGCFFFFGGAFFFFCFFLSLFFFYFDLQLLGCMLCRILPGEFWLNAAWQSTGYFSLQWHKMSRQWWVCGGGCSVTAMVAQRNWRKIWALWLCKLS